MASNPQPKRTNRVAPREPPPKENRDPNSINDHLVIDFYSVLAEPPNSPQSIDCTWEFSEVCFNCFLECWYKLMSLLCGVCIAIYWGLQFVPVVFANVWVFTPLRQLFHIVCGVWCKTACTICVRCAIRPVMRSCGHIFINCGDGTIDRSPTPPIFPPSKPRQRPKPKPEVKEQPKEVEDTKHVPLVPVKGEFDDYDKEKIARSVKRTMMFY